MQRVRVCGGRVDVGEQLVLERVARRLVRYRNLDLCVLVVVSVRETHDVARVGAAHVDPRAKNDAHFAQHGIRACAACEVHLEGRLPCYLLCLLRALEREN
jgi:hypothetical protein